MLTEQINHGLPSDCLIAEWHLDAARVCSICRSDQPLLPPLCPTERFLTRMDKNRRPRTSALAGDAASCLIEILADIQHLKSTDAAAALSWRMAVRESLRPHSNTDIPPPDADHHVATVRKAVVTYFQNIELESG